MEKTSTDLAHRYDLIRVEALPIGTMTRSARGTVEKINPAWTSQTCNTCGVRDRQARENQAAFRCRSCGYQANADVNAARNIALGHQWATTWVTARGGDADSRPVNREPRHCTPPLPVDV
nr:zinc ribbon domain-containing protein [Frankia tisae]